MMTLFEKIEHMYKKQDTYFAKKVQSCVNVHTREGFPARFVALLDDVNIPARLIMEVPSKRVSEGEGYDDWRMVNYFTNGRLFQGTPSDMDLIVYGVGDNDPAYLPSWVHEEYPVKSKSVWLMGDHKDYISLSKKMGPQYREMLNAMGLSGTPEELRNIDLKNEEDDDES